MSYEAQQLAKLLVNSGQRKIVEHISLEPDEIIVVVAVRIKGGAQKSTEVREIMEAVSGPYGTVCPRCGGTGKVSP